MNEMEIRKLIRTEIRNSMDIILSGFSGNATTQTEDIQNMYPGMTGIVGRPTAHPYGFCSVAPDGTAQVVAKQGEHIGNRLVISHRDANRPSDITSGESVLYNEFGQAVYMRDGQVQVGTKNSNSPMVLGDVLLNFITDLLNAFQNAPDVGITPFGPAFLEPQIRTAMTQMMEKYVTNVSTNVVSKLTFTERGP